MLQSLFTFLVINTASVYFTSQLLDGFQLSEGYLAVVIVGLVLGILNSFIRPVLRVISFPLIVVTGGLFAILINVVLLWITVQFIEIIEIGGVTLAINGFWGYAFSAVIFGFLNYLFHKILG